VARFTDPAALAAAPVEDVLRAWSGLGYNRRALALQSAARIVSATGWPEDLTSLPGVGEYTAAAVGAFAFGRQVAAVDTNARRVIERWDGVKRRPGELERRAAEWLPPDKAVPFNQAMMELGATVCTPRKPRCDGCPVKPGCETHATGGVPVHAPAAKRRPAERFEDSDRYARGRVIAALIAGERPPDWLGPARLARALEGLVRDGLIVREAGGRVRLP
jgi:A/G-specific adenine glycosylase